MSAHFGEPVEVVRCKTVDLRVPATSEIVIEGYISDTEKHSEGPMGEFAGYTPKKQYLPMLPNKLFEQLQGMSRDYILHRRRLSAQEIRIFQFFRCAYS